MNFGDMVYGKGLQSPMSSQIQFGMYIGMDGNRIKFLEIGYFPYEHRKPKEKGLPLFNLNADEWEVFSSSLMAPFEPLQWEMLSMRANEFIALMFTNMPTRIKK